MDAHKKTYVFKNSYLSSIINSIFIMIMIYIFFKFVIPVYALMQYRPPLGVDVLEATKEKDVISILLTIPHLMFYFPTAVSSAVLLPLMRYMLGCTVSSESVSGISSLVPFLAIRRNADWKDIKAVEYLDLWFQRFYLLRNERRNILAFISFDLDNFEEFKKAIELCAPPGHCFKTLLRREQRSYFLNVFPILENKMENLFIDGTLIKETEGTQEPLTYRKIQVVFDDQVMVECMTNGKGEFHVSFTHIPGAYCLRSKDSSYCAESEILLPRRGGEKVILIGKGQ